MEREIILGWIDNRTLKAGRVLVTRARQYYDAAHGLFLFLSLVADEDNDDNDDDDDDGGDDDDHGILTRQDSVADKARHVDANRDFSDGRSANAAKMLRKIILENNASAKLKIPNRYCHNAASSPRVFYYIYLCSLSAFGRDISYTVSALYFCKYLI